MEALAHAAHLSLTNNGDIRLKPAQSAEPTLGRVWASYQQGYGEARPSTVNNGGDPTGLVRHVTWESWGKSTAIGHGISVDASHAHSVAEAPSKRATIEAFDLGNCAGRLMYKAVEWWFPSDGQHFDPNRYINICTGDYVGD
jgi:hypothetical protein